MSYKPVKLPGFSKVIIPEQNYTRDQHVLLEHSSVTINSQHMEITNDYVIHAN